MALEQIIGGLKDKGNGYKTVNPSYSATTLTGTSDFFDAYAKADTTTVEGLKQYEAVTGLKTAGRSKNQMALEYKQINSAVGEGIEGYIAKHTESTAKEILEPMRAEIAYKFSPEEDSKIQGSGKYLAATKIVGGKKKVIADIRADPEAYVNTVISAAPDFMKGIVGRYPGEVCQVDMEAAQKDAFRAIAGVTAEKYIAETHSGQTKLRDIYRAEAEKIQKDKTDLVNKMPAHYNAVEEAKYFEGIRKREEALETTKEDFKTLPQLTDTLFGEAVAAIKARTTPATPATP